MNAEPQKLRKDCRVGLGRLWGIVQARLGSRVLDQMNVTLEETISRLDTAELTEDALVAVCRGRHDLPLCFRHHDHNQ